MLSLRPRPEARGLRSEDLAMHDALVVLVTAPSPDQAAEIARALVEERLAACGNVVPAIRSIYRWEGKVHDDAEALLVLKTTRGRFEALRDRVLALHPYDVPEVLALPVEAGNAAYLAWIAAETG
jgi:periplasmic divalent cation tolerance protein